MADKISPPKKPTDVTISRAKGRPMLSWVGKKPLGRVTAFPAQQMERFSAVAAASQKQLTNLLGAADWSKWPHHLQEQGLKGGLLTTATTRRLWRTCWPTAFAARSN